MTEAKKATGHRKTTGKPAGNKKPTAKQKAERASTKARTEARLAKAKVRAEQREELRRKGKSPHWFGVPRWIVGAVVVGVLVFLVAYKPWAVPSAQVRGIVAALRTSSIYQAPGAPPVPDAPRVRQILGDRPIVVVAMPNTPLPPATTDEGDDDALLGLCEQIADQITNDYVVLLGTANKADGGTGHYQMADCYGPGFPVPDKKPVTGKDHDDQMFAFDFGVSHDSQAGAQFQDIATDLTPAIEEFVLAYDDDVAAGYTTPPRRGAVPDRLAGNDIALDGAAMIAGVLALFALLRQAARWLGGRQAEDAGQRNRRTALGLRLNQIADTVLHPRPALTAEEAHAQEDVAERYLALLERAERARGGGELTEAEQEADELVRLARS